MSGGLQISAAQRLTAANRLLYAAADVLGGHAVSVRVVIGDSDLYLAIEEQAGRRVVLAFDPEDPLVHLRDRVEDALAFRRTRTPRFAVIGATA